SSLADRREIGEEGRDVLEVVDGEAQRLVALEQRVEDLRADRTDRRAARGGIELVLLAGGERLGLDLGEHFVEGGPCLGNGLGGPVVEGVAQAPQASCRFARTAEELSVPALLCRMERHRPSFCSARRAWLRRPRNLMQPLLHTQGGPLLLCRGPFFTNSIEKPEKG